MNNENENKMYMLYNLKIIKSLAEWETVGELITLFERKQMTYL